MTRSILAAMLAVSMLLTPLFTACDSIHTPDPMTDVVNYSSDHPQAQKAEGETPSADFVHAAADFGFLLLKQTEKKDAMMISPLSILCALGMTANGAAGDTLSQMENTLFGGMALSEANRYIRGFLDAAPTIGPTTLRIADSLWLNDGAVRFDVKADFLNTNAAYYDADVYGYDFAEGPARINRWVASKTDNMIPSLIDALPEGSLMVLTNAVLFDGKWEQTYEDRYVSKGIFTSLDGTTAEREMLWSEENGYFRLGEGVGFVRPYNADEGQARYSFVGILPDEGVNVYDYLDSFTGADFVEAVRHLSYGRDVYVRIPTMEFDTDAELGDILSESMPAAFDPELADFSGISETTQGLSIAQVVHKTRLELTREGTKAAAATAVMVTGATAIADPVPPIRIYLDRPFVFAIIETDSGLPVFCGSVTSLT